jgi:hypothetical protein
VTQGVDPEFKPQYFKKKERKKKETERRVLDAGPESQTCLAHLQPWEICHMTRLTQMLAQIYDFFIAKASLN